MSNQEHELTHQDLRQYLLNEIEVSKQAIENCSDEELEAAVGGALTGFQKAALAVGGMAATALSVGTGTAIYNTAAAEAERRRRMGK